jgi:L-ribulose-5-phosphate 3-epimerase
MTLLLGYNTNGLADHDLIAAVALLAEIGYRSVAITIDHHALAPGGGRSRRQLTELRGLLRRLEMRSVIETGARFLLDPRQKHEPTLVSADPAGRRRRIEFTKYAVRIAAELESDCVSLWSGVLRDAGDRSAPEISEPGHVVAERPEPGRVGPERPGRHAPALNGETDIAATPDEAMAWLVEGLEEVVEYAAGRGVAIGFEPEPGMLIDSMGRYEELLTRLDAPNFRLTLDVGHLHCQGEVPIADQIRRWAGRLVNVHIEDMRRGRHEHLMFGEGEIEFPPVLRALAEVRYQGGVHVELSRHSHEGPIAAQKAFEFLNPIIKAS